MTGMDQPAKNEAAPGLREAVERVVAGEMIRDSRPLASAEIERMLSILREYEMHEPSCEKRQIERAQRQTSVFFPPGECNCWLSNGSPEADLPYEDGGGMHGMDG